MLRKYLDSRYLKIVGAVGILVIIGLLWFNGRRAIVEKAHEFYLVGDCENALPLHEQVESDLSIIGRFDFDIYQEINECAVFLAAELMEEDGSEQAIRSYEAFVAAYPDSPLTTPALAAIHRLYLDWAEAERERGAYQPAISILEKATADYPALEAETEERLLQTYLAWGAALQSAGHTDQAITIYEELQRRYPQFTVEAQAAINRK